MKAYFTASISGRDKYLNQYESIVSILKELNFKVLEETISVSKEYVYDEISDQDKVEYYKKVISWMNQADIVVVEASYPSLSIGHEISLALEKNKPVVVLYCEGNAPHFLVGVKTEKLLVEKYDDSTLKIVLKNSIEYAIEQQDVRFNFFVSPKIANYLDWMSRVHRTPGSMHLRRLIEKDMEKYEAARLEEA